MTAIRAFLSGLGAVMRAPLTVAAACLLTFITAVPFALVMGERVQHALNDQPPIVLGSEEIDADWWLEFRRHAEGLEATFTPAIIGFAAPLSNLSAVLDGELQSTVMLVPIAIAIVTWSFLWGVAIERFRSGGSRRAGALIQAGLRSLPRFVAIAVAAAVAQLILYFTIHKLLFAIVFPAITGGMANEAAAFAVRVVLYLVFGLFIAAVSLVADYSRIASALRDSAGGAAFVRANWGSALSLLVVVTFTLGVFFLLYGVGEAYGGSRVAGWRGVLIGQAFVILRIAMRLVTIASEVQLFERRSRSY
jgi:hypothetical protein